MPKILQDVRIRDNKAKTFAPPDNNDKFDEMDDLVESTLALNNLTNLKKIRKFKENTIGKYKKIDLNRVDDLYDKRKNINIDDDNEYVHFRNLLDFLSDIKNGKINNFNKKEEYEKKFISTQNEIINRKAKSNIIMKIYIKYLNDLENILFSDKKSSGKGLNISALPTLLSKIYTNNSSKKLISDIKQLINNLYNYKQITKQIYKNLIKAITY